MRQLVRPECRDKCRFLQITPTIWLCPHASYGAGTNLKGAVEEARRLLERQGGYDVVLSRIVAAEEEQRAAKREQ